MGIGEPVPSARGCDHGSVWIVELGEALEAERRIRHGHQDGLVPLDLVTVSRAGREELVDLHKIDAEFVTHDAVDPVPGDLHHPEVGREPHDPEIA